MTNKLHIILSALLTVCLAGCVSSPALPPEAQAHIKTGLAAGDLVRVTVFNHTELSGDFTVDNAGLIWLPLVGGIKTLGLTNFELQSEIANQLQPDYLTNPDVTVEVISHRPIYLLGEVGRPGSYPYSDTVSVAKAVALAGGFTYRAATKKIKIARTAPDGSVQQLSVSLDTPVQGGDLITVPQRFF